VVKAASNSGIEVVGLEDSFDGLIEPDRSRVLTPRDVTGILRLGGTILGTTNRGNPFAYPVATSEGIHDYSNRVVEMFHKMGLDALVVIGGDGTLAIAHQFCNRGVPLVGVPKTIDNDFDIRIVAEWLCARDRWGAKFSIVVVAEGACPLGAEAARQGFPGASGGSAPRSPKHSRRKLARKRGRSCSATCSAATRRRASIACWRRALAARRSSSSAEANSARWSPSRRRTSSRAGSTTWWGRPRECR